MMLPFIPIGKDSTRPLMMKEEQQVMHIHNQHLYQSLVHEMQNVDSGSSALLVM